VSNPFPEWLAEVVADPVVVQPDDIEFEARGNLWTFSLSPEQTVAVSVADVEEFAVGVVDGRKASLSARRAAPMVMYWWHDAQAAQLRFSMVSVAHGRLPFGCAVVTAASLSAVASSWLMSPTVNGISWGQLRQLTSDEVEPETPQMVLTVWSERIP
jgi:hypothetical protein